MEEFIITLKNGKKLITDREKKTWACGYTEDFGRCALSSLRELCYDMKQYKLIYFAQITDGEITTPFYPYHEVESFESTNIK